MGLGRDWGLHLMRNDVVIFDHFINTAAGNLGSAILDFIKRKSYWRKVKFFYMQKFNVKNIYI